MSLKDVVGQRLLEEMIRPVSSPLKILIVDHLSMRILSACLRMYDIIEEGVTLVEKVTIERQPMPAMDAIYFLTPTTESVDLMIADFADPKNRKYKNAHLFFTSSIPQSVMSKIGGSNLVKHVQTLKEVQVEFLALESQSFTLDEPNGLGLFFSPKSNLQDSCRMVAKKLATVCFALGENPFVRFSKSMTPAGALAAAVQDELDAFYSNNRELMNDRPRGTLLILDRSQDPVAPILHEFTYQAMCYDLLDIENDIYTYKYEMNNGSVGTKEVLLNETDALWPTLRHMHIADSINHVIEMFNEFVASNQTATQKKEGVKNLKQMSEAIRGLPQYREMLSKYSLHIDVNKACMSKFNELMLRDVGNLEQNMVMGETAEGEKCKSLLGDMMRLLETPGMSVENKHRLLMTYIISQEGIKESDRSQLMEKAQVSHDDQATFLNLSLLGVTLNAAKKSKFGGKKSKDKKKTRTRDDVPYELSRYLPQVRLLCEDLIDGTLPADQFPYVKEPSSEPSSAATARSGKGMSMRTHQPRWTRKKNKGGKEERKSGGPEVSGARVIVFMVGGMTCSEMRAAYEVTASHHREVLVGSTHIVKAKSFIKELKELKDAEL